MGRRSLAAAIILALLTAKNAASGSGDLNLSASGRAHSTRLAFHDLDAGFAEPAPPSDVFLPIGMLASWRLRAWATPGSERIVERSTALALACVTRTGPSPWSAIAQLEAGVPGARPLARDLVLELNPGETRCVPLSFSDVAAPDAAERAPVSELVARLSVAGQTLEETRAELRWDPVPARVEIDEEARLQFSAECPQGILCEIVPAGSGEAELRLRNVDRCGRDLHGSMTALAFAATSGRPAAQTLPLRIHTGACPRHGGWWLNPGSP